MKRKINKNISMFFIRFYFINQSLNFSNGSNVVDLNDDNDNEGFQRFFATRMCTRPHASKERIIGHSFATERLLALRNKNNETTCCNIPPGLR